MTRVFVADASTRLDATREDDDRASTALTRARYHSPARLVRDRRVDCETLTLF